MNSLDGVNEMEGMELKYIEKAIANPNNDVISKYSTEEIEDIKRQILEDVPISGRRRKEILMSLRGYRYVDELSELREGAYMRWIPLESAYEGNRRKEREGVKLTTGGILCDIRVTESGVALVCKNGLGRFFQCRMETSLVFQKLTEQEKVILYTMDVVSVL